MLKQTGQSVNIRWIWVKVYIGVLYTMRATLSLKLFQKKKSFKNKQYELSQIYYAPNFNTQDTTSSWTHVLIKCNTVTLFLIQGVWTNNTRSSFVFFKKYLFILREREHACEQGRSREKVNPKQALRSVQSSTQCLISRPLGSWCEPKSRVNPQPTELLRCPNKFVV